MPTDRHFVGRQSELDLFLADLEDSTGKAFLIVGQPGMGKTFLAQRMLELAESHTTLMCGAVSYEVTATDSAEAVMERMLEDGYAATQEGSFSASPHRRRQWKTLFEAVIPKGKDLLALTAALRHNPKRPARDQLVLALSRLSDELPEHHRILFLIDSEKYMTAGSDDPWRLVVEQLPPKAVLLFAQRPDDSLAGSPAFRRLPNVIRVPEVALPPLGTNDVDQLLRLCAPVLPHPSDKLRAYFVGLDGHPYAVAAALDLLLAGTPLDKLPTDPGGIAAEQWRKAQRNGDDVGRLLEAHAILEIAVPDEFVCTVAGIEPRAHRRLLAEPYLAGLLSTKAVAPHAALRQIYHTLLAEAVRSTLTPREVRALHYRAADAYVEHLRASGPAPVAALRLAEHVLQAEGPQAFAELVADQIAHYLHDLGLLEEAEHLITRARETGPLDPSMKAALFNPLARIYLTRGDLDRAEVIIRDTLKISEDLERLEGIASALGNLGVIHRIRGDLDAAEESAARSLALHEGMGAREAMATQNGNLATIYRMRGDLDRATEMATRSLALSEEVDNPGGVADAYAQLGLIHRARRDLDQALDAHRRSLGINQDLGRLEGVASDYDNLGVIFQIRNELGLAEEAHNASLIINQKLGRMEGVANAYGNLATLHQGCGHLDKAEELHNRSLAIGRAMGLLEGMARTFGNLGWISHQRADLKAAQDHWRQSLELFRRIGARNQAAEVSAWLKGLDKPESQDNGD